jgi:hypothetical protein
MRGTEKFLLSGMPWGGLSSAGPSFLIDLLACIWGEVYVAMLGMFS